MAATTVAAIVGSVGGGYIGNKYIHTHYLGAFIGGLIGGVLAGIAVGYFIVEKNKERYEQKINYMVGRQFIKNKSLIIYFIIDLGGWFLEVFRGVFNEIRY